jgi:hypothetical protein
MLKIHVQATLDPVKYYSHLSFIELIIKSGPAYHTIWSTKWLQAKSTNGQNTTHSILILCCYHKKNSISSFCLWLGLSFMWSNHEHKSYRTIKVKLSLAVNDCPGPWQMAHLTTTSLQVRNWYIETSCYHFQICYHTWQFSIYKDSLLLLENNLQPVILISNKNEAPPGEPLTVH